MVFITTIFFTTTTEAAYFDKSQQEIAKKIYDIGKTFKTIDGMSIENTLTAISLRESSLGKFILGDKDENGVFKPIEKMSLGIFQIQLRTAKEVIKNSNLKEYQYLLEKDSLLVNKLLTDIKLGATISAHYFINNYNEAVRRNMWNPYFRAVSRHNGGWNNKRYYRVFLKDMEKIKKLNLDM